MKHDPRRMTEMDLHSYVVGLLTNCAAPDVVWRHVPNGELRDKATAAKLKRMGVLPGSFDFDLFIPDQRPCFLEVKGDGGRPTPEQKWFELAMTRMGCKCAYAKTPEQARAILVEWGAVRSTASLRLAK